MAGSNPAPAGGGAIDNGEGFIADESLHLTAEESAMLEQMRAADDTPADGGDAPIEDPAPEPDPANASATPETPTEGLDIFEEEAPDHTGQPERKPRRVSARKLQKIQDELNQTRTQLETAKTERTKLDERLSMLLGAFNKKPAAEPAAPAKDPFQAKLEALGARPDPNEDVIGYATWEGKRNDILQERLDSMNADSRRSREETELKAFFSNDAQVFGTKQKDFGDSYRYLMNTRLQELALYMYGIDASDQEAVNALSPQQRNDLITAFNAEERTIVENAKRSNKSPAQMIYQLAKMRGYTPAAEPAAAAASVPAAKTPGDLGEAAAALAAGRAPMAPAAKPTASAQQPGAPAAKPSVTESIAAIKSGQQSQLSLSDGSGGSQQPLTGADLLKLTDAEFAQMLETASPEQLEQLLGN